MKFLPHDWHRQRRFVQVDSHPLAMGVGMSRITCSLRPVADQALRIAAHADGGGSRLLH